jgi:hypothetical protein
MAEYWLKPMPPHLADIVKVIRDCPPFRTSHEHL